MSAPRFLALVLAGLIALFAGLNLFTGVVLDSVRLDLTERGLYRLSPGTLEVLAVSYTHLTLPTILRV